MLSTEIYVFKFIKTRLYSAENSNVRRVETQGEKGDYKSSKITKVFHFKMSKYTISDIIYNIIPLFISNMDMDITCESNNNCKYKLCNSLLSL